MNEKRYKVTLNWYGEIHEFWTHANSKRQARASVLKKFAEERGLYTVQAYFMGQKDNIKIEEA